MLFKFFQALFRLFDNKLYRNNEGVFLEVSCMEGILITAHKVTTTYKIERTRYFCRLYELSD